MKLLSWMSAMTLLLSFSGAELHRQTRQVSAGTQPGLCRYGWRLDCCYGWKKNSKGFCEAQCEHGCKHGECVGPNKCKCFPGYTGKTCSQDLNECGLKPRPCEHRCMNTHGSYMCYCLNGYMLMADGSCADSRTCLLAHCQYGCEEVQGHTRCLCPSLGLQLAPDQRTCVDIDECTSMKNPCPYNRRCVNTFGSYFCKCQIGFDLKYVNGKYDCADIDECGDGSHRCSLHASCLNTQGSYKCKCKAGFRGNGTECTAKPFFQHSWDVDRGSADEFLNAIPDLLLKAPHSKLDSEQKRNLIPESASTSRSKTHLQPFDYDGDVYIGNPGETEPNSRLPEKEGQEEQEEEQETPVGPRGDVFFPVFGPQSEVKEISVDPGKEEAIMDCDFDQGTCEWVQDKEDDFDWNVAYHDKGPGYYMAASLLGQRKDVARLKLLLNHGAQRAALCLAFNYRLVGEQVGTLRVLLDNSGYPAWEQRSSRGRAWQTELLTVAWEDEPPQSIIFEAERGKGVSGEIGLDNVTLTPGSCEEHDSVIF
ncbi:epidermal growth factor-like protein 6 isoform X1 [Paramormyrops kingsleyae]|uniref:EGF-like-domain, multiple 6 n=1 Tax=Paramormyrops kingsleyae TaxID=1676925 RepID=A0A3B3SKC2_9TELE|nr:epidermal growth factor-like protein 6 isoform X1 [Paramormyrops kingsleyae]